DLRRCYEIRKTSGRILVVRTVRYLVRVEPGRSLLTRVLGEPSTASEVDKIAALWTVDGYCSALTCVPAVAGDTSVFEVVGLVEALDHPSTSRRVYAR